MEVEGVACVGCWGVGDIWRGWMDGNMRTLDRVYNLVMLCGIYAYICTNLFQSSVIGADLLRLLGLLAAH